MADKPIRLVIKSLYSSLSLKEQFIADYILEHPEDVAKNSISDIADTLNIAASTFFQFTRKLGYNGFKDFKVALLMENQMAKPIAVNENILESDSEIDIAKKIFDYNTQTINDTKGLLGEEDLSAAVTMIQKANIILFAGMGGSEIVAADAYQKFMRAPIHCFHTADYHMQLMQTSLLKEDDCVVVISHSGQSTESIQIAAVAKRNKASVIVVTSYPQSDLAKLGDVVFVSISDETFYRSEALSSRIAQLSIIDALYVILMFRSGEGATDSLQKVRRVIREIKS